MEKIYIVTAGDSFTDSHLPFISSDNIDSQWGLHDKFINYIELCSPDYSMKYQYFLIKELIESGIEFEYYNLGIGSAGNHVIAHRYKKKIKELLDKGIDPKNIYGTLQLSGLCRQTDPIYEIEFGLKDIEGSNWDYMNHVDPTKTYYKDVLEAHILNLENIVKWNKDNGIEHFNMFFGWAIYYENELIQYGLKDRFDAIDTTSFFRYEYREADDLIANTCVGGKQILKSLFGIKPKYTIKAGKYGGMTEFIRDLSFENEYYYIAIWDPHLNTFGNYTFYREYYRKLFEKWGVLTSNNNIENNIELWAILKKIFKVNNEAFLDSYTNNFQTLPQNELQVLKNERKEYYYKKYFTNVT